MHSVENLLKLASAQIVDDGVNVLDAVDAFVRQPDALDGLHDFSLRSPDPTLSLAAILLVKNNILPYWRNIRAPQLSPGARHAIRARCLDFFDSPDAKLTELNALILSKLARIDYPRFWPGLVDDIKARLSPELAVSEPGHLLRLSHALYALHRITKEIASIRIANRVFPLLYASLFPFALAVYQLAFSHLASHPNWISLATYAYKVLASLSLHNWSRCSGDERSNTVQFTQLQLSLLPRLLDCTHSSRSPPLQLLNAHTRFLLRLQQSNQGRFRGIQGIEALIPILYSQIAHCTHPSSPAAPPKHLIHALLILKLSLADWVPHAPHKLNPHASLSDDFAIQVIDLVARRFLPLTPADLARWESDPETWVYEDDLDHWEVDLRPCAQNLVLAVLIKRRGAVGAHLTSLLHSAAESSDVIYKEGVYRIVAKCAEYLYDHVSFERWLDTTLIPEVQVDSVGHGRILRRRIAILVGRFAGENLTPSARTKVYTIILHCLRAQDAENDVAVQISAAIALAGIVDTWDFAPALFEPYMGAVVAELMRILAACTLGEIKTKVLASLTCIVDQVGDMSMPHALPLLEMVGGLWEADGDSSADADWHLRGGMLALLARLVCVMQEGSQRALPLVVPLIRTALDPAQGKPYIDMDAIELWQVTLKHAAGHTDSIHGLFPLAVELFANDVDLSEPAGALIESHMYLSGMAVVSESETAQLLFRACAGVVEYASDAVRAQAIHLVHLAALIAPPATWWGDMHTSGLFPAIVSKLLSESESVLLSAQLVVVCARIALVDTPLLLHLLECAAEVLGVSPQTTLVALLDRWCDRWDNISDEYSRALAAAGLARLVEHGIPLVLTRLAELSSIFVDILAQIRENHLDAVAYGEQPDSTTPHTHSHTPITHPLLNAVGDEGTCEKTRRLTLFSTDPLAALPIPPLISHSFAHAQQSFPGGPDAFNQSFLANADHTVVAQLVAFINETMS
ncbi:hypothetical protein E3P81_02137 [Wallemia ichthyophaga]|nr:hypothetical protein E3P97_02136 [Wallemia ichthyophaga]TIB32786.1 hypothetical protein E3P85_01685 [Wallemia ichthyophaga]TIB46490.1 hypothetical protein E3P82_02134 [Wallemia ichthyophaga]TIB50502.1 hypothetical protein E3P81_02137 [Wallemia ichthyophaga]TIB53496.1 hypothetical protein E3P80_02135 [Wallemia ichthyophaga]